MDWVLIAFALFKGLVFVAGMHFAIKWHYDQELKGTDRRTLVRMGSKFVAAFVLLLLLVLLFTFGLARMLGMDLSLP
ncbi:hypothetical protein NYO99_11315 [Pelomonas sp. UHG3]|uniref:Uncharacterized protein n=1 Tax=Roseateles hydrophilus TaxID=2975054 RepID=A0ACC6CAX8_9BURK|nr:hypothetical protein [Pelomonas sp. UHG3]MCY4745561.1 hypothetical protein [Pelomonas sp. UHG3]